MQTAYIFRLAATMFFVSNSLSLSKWMSQQEKKMILNDFFLSKRDYSKRYHLYEYVINRVGLNDAPINYIEFGVSAGHSIKWWAEHIKHSGSRFYGFDTFEGLPENWGTFHKGDMNSRIPQLDDERVIFIKGLFQKTVPNFISHQFEHQQRKVIHFDADLFSATLFALTSMAPLLQSATSFFSTNLMCPITNI